MQSEKSLKSALLAELENAHNGEIAQLKEKDFEHQARHIARLRYPQLHYCWSLRIALKGVLGTFAEHMLQNELAQKNSEIVVARAELQILRERLRVSKQVHRQPCLLT